MGPSFRNLQGQLMSPETPLDTLKAIQRAWAVRNRLHPDKDGYCACVDDNITFKQVFDGALLEVEAQDVSQAQVLS